MSGIRMPKFTALTAQRILKRTLLVLIILVVVLFSAGIILSRIAENKVEQALQRVGGSVGSIDINLFLQRVTISDIDIAPGADTTTVPTQARIQSIVLKNLNLFSTLVHRHLKFDELLIDNGTVVFNTTLKIDSSTNTSRKPPPLENISIEKITIRNIDAAIVNDTVPKYSGIVAINLKNFHLMDIASASLLQAFTLDSFDASVRKVEIHDEKNLYTISIGEVAASSGKKNLTIDSLLLKPQHSKFKFSRIAGKQTDRINAFIRTISINNIRYDQLKDSAFIASSIAIADAEVYSFRDKRVPFHEIKNKPLPMTALQDLPMAIEIDSITISKTKITYEEFPEEGFSSGRITFEDLDAKLLNLSNRKYYNKPNFSTLTARAKLMGKGLIQASFRLPLDEKPYQAQGRISNMALYHLNPALENLAFISIESGRLNEINFDFSYTDDVADGTLLINYQNLKVNGLKKEKGVAVNDLKTLLINALIKNDKDKSMAADKRTGTISFERDKKRQIFNYWWKSLLSGIKGSVLSMADKKPK